MSSMAAGASFSSLWHSEYSPPKLGVYRYPLQTEVGGNKDGYGPSSFHSNPPAWQLK